MAPDRECRRDLRTLATTMARARADPTATARQTVVALAVVFAAMNVCFYVAIDRLPLGTVAAIEFVPVIALQLWAPNAQERVALGSRSSASLCSPTCGSRASPSAWPCLRKRPALR